MLAGLSNLKIMIPPGPRILIITGPKMLMTPGPKIWTIPGPKMLTTPGPNILIIPGPMFLLSQVLKLKFDRISIKSQLQIQTSWDNMVGWQDKIFSP